MPIVHCFIKEKEVIPSKIDDLIAEWAHITGIETKDICLNMITDFYQFGQQYSILVNLYLPTLWAEHDVKRIQIGLLRVISKYLDVFPEKVFIMTSWIQPGHVVENGEIVDW